MADLKTVKTDKSVSEYINAIEDPQKKKDCKELLKMMKAITKKRPDFWSHGVVGFGTYVYKGASGRTGEWYITGFSPRKTNITVYLMWGMSNKELLKKLGKYKAGGGCLYINKLADVDTKVLSELIKYTVKNVPVVQK